MALTTTTLNGAVAIDQNTITLTSATGVTSKMLGKIDDEIVEFAQGYVSGTAVGVLRGREGTATQAHATGANVTFGTAADWAAFPPQVTSSNPIAAKARPLISYSAAGAIALPLPGADAVAVLNGTNALAMTLANPTKDMDGSILAIIGNGKAAHTVTYTAGLGNSGSGADVLTFDTGGQCTVVLIAANAIWVPYPSPYSGTLTAFDVAVA